MKWLFRLLCLLLASTAFAQNTYLKSTSGYKIFSQGIASSNEYVYQAISHSGFLQFSDDSTFSYQSEIIFDLKVKTLISQCLFNGVNIENLEIENFNLNKNQNSVDFYVIENEIYLFGWPTDNTLIIGHKIIEVNGSNPILIKLNEHLEYVGHHSLQNSFNGIKLRLVKNQNELFITAFTAIDYDFQPYFAKSEPAFVILKMDNNLIFSLIP